MSALELCDGSVDLSMPFIPRASKEFVRNLEENGVVEQCQAGAGLTERQKYRKYPARYIRQAHWSITGKYVALTANPPAPIVGREGFANVRPRFAYLTLTVSVTVLAFAFS